MHAGGPIPTPQTSHTRTRPPARPALPRIPCVRARHRPHRRRSLNAAEKTSRRWGRPAKSGRAAHSTATPRTPTRCTFWNRRPASRRARRRDAGGGGSGVHVCGRAGGAGGALAHAAGRRRWGGRVRSGTATDACSPRRPAGSAVRPQHQPRRRRPARSDGVHIRADIRGVRHQESVVQPGRSLPVRSARGGRRRLMALTMSLTAWPPDWRMREVQLVEQPLKRIRDGPQRPA